MNREQIRSAEQNLIQAKRKFYRGDKSELRELLIKAIRHVTKTLLMLK